MDTPTQSLSPEDRVSGLSNRALVCIPEQLEQPSPALVVLEHLGRLNTFSFHHVYKRTISMRVPGIPRTVESVPVPYSSDVRVQFHRVNVWRSIPIRIRGFIHPSDFTSIECRL